MKNYFCMLCAHVFFLFVYISQPLSSYRGREVTCFGVVWTMRVLDDNVLIISSILGASRATISNGNRNEWSPIRSVIIRVINKIGQPQIGSPICL